MRSAAAHGSCYDGRPVALLTQHGKERVLAPVLQAALGCRVELVGGYDTDQLGTFTRDIPRDGSQLEAARRKARIGMTLARLPLGLASEGSFGADPFTGALPWNVELLVWIDAERELEVVGIAQGGAAFAHLLASTWIEVESFATQMGFPTFGLIVRPDSAAGLPVLKGINTRAELIAAFDRTQRHSETGSVFVESDLRAHANPTRMEMIRRAAQDLAAKLESTCPACAAPGFAAVECVRGLPCSECGAPTQELSAEILACVKCSHRVTRHFRGRLGDPGYCDYCNP